MKLQSLVLAAVMSLPVVSFAQSNQPLTRADVRAQLVELEKAGYNPGSDATQYPRNIEEAQARVNAQHGIGVANNSYGGSGSASSAAGAKAQGVNGSDSIYARP
jgi:hypothetical protein